MRRSLHQRRPLSRRQGMLAPLVAVALLVVMGCLAVIVDRMWLEAARLELTTAAEAAALAAASHLAGDVPHQRDPQLDQQLIDAREAAAQVAARNRVAGDPVLLDTTDQGDIRFGNLQPRTSDALGWDDSSQPGPTLASRFQFVEDETAPHTVVVTAQRTRSRNNPVGLFVSGLTGLDRADVRARAEATLTGGVIGIRPYIGTPAPLLPIAIWEHDASANRTDTWESAIEQRTGGDLWSFDPVSGQPKKVSDGISELVLITRNPSQPAEGPNFLLIDLGTGFRTEGVSQQIRMGVVAGDLESFGGFLALNAGVVATTNPYEQSANGTPESAASDGGVTTSTDETSRLGASGGSYQTVTLDTQEQITSNDVNDLATQLGVPRLALLYSQIGIPATSTPPNQNASTGRTPAAVCTRLVALRVLDISGSPQSGLRITVQPTTLTTPTAIVGTPVAKRVPHAEYAYKLQLTY